jgi:hypothetical protein
LNFENRVKEMNKEQFHKKVEILAHKIGSVKKAFETLNSEHQIFLQELYYRQWKSKNGFTTHIISNCLICGTEIKYLKTKKWCSNHARGKFKPAKKRLPMVNGQPMTKNKLAQTWYGIKARCRSSKSISYKNYGGRGIKMCDLWHDDFYEFEKWSLANGYKKGLQIDRINNNGNYEPTNCRYVEPYINAANRRSLVNTTGFIGVHTNVDSKNYRVKIGIKNKNIELGHFKTKIEAAIFRDVYIIKNNLPHTKNLL